jgi:outer membrane lipoprotein-sorting protein
VQYPNARIAMLIIFAAAVVAIIPLFDSGSTALAAPDLVEPFLNAKTATFTITARIDGKDRPLGKAYISGSVARMETDQNGMKQIMITDAAKHVSLSLDPQTNQATLIQTVNFPPGDEPPGMFDQLKQIAKLFASSGDQQGVKRESLGEQRIDGRKLVGYRIAAESECMELWADSKTKMPYLMLQRMTAPNSADTVETRWSYFQFNVKLDPSLFSTDPPAGYKVNGHVVDVAPANEAAFIKALQEYAKITNGSFPDTLDAEITITTFARSFAPNSYAYYAGKHVQQNTEDRPIFWYTPKGTKTYRIIYADLSVKENASPPKVASTVRIGNHRSTK